MNNPIDDPTLCLLINPPPAWLNTPSPRINLPPESDLMPTADSTGTGTPDMARFPRPENSLPCPGPHAAGSAWEYWHAFDGADLDNPRTPWEREEADAIKARAETVSAGLAIEAAFAGELASRYAQMDVIKAQPSYLRIK